MGYTCNKCENMIHKDVDTEIYSGYLCNKGLWDERGAHTDDHGDVENRYDNPFKFAIGDYWVRCQAFGPINYNKIPIELFWECKYCGENKMPMCHKCVRQDGKLVSDELTLK